MAFFLFEQVEKKFMPIEALAKYPPDAARMIQCGYRTNPFVWCVKQAYHKLPLKEKKRYRFTSENSPESFRDKRNTQ